MPRLLRFGLAAVGAALAACGSIPGMLGENFPPHDIAFASYSAPEFPYRLRATPIGSGYAIMVITVGSDGRISDAVGVEASHTDFINAVLEVMPDWVVIAQETDSFPRREVLQFQFQRSGVATSVSHREAARKPFAEIEDSQPAVRMVSAQQYMPNRANGDTQDVGAVSQDGPTGSVDVSFVIDREGRVRVPVTSADADPALARAALGVVRRWQFEAPAIDGEPVVVEVSRSLSFSPVAD